MAEENKPETKVEERVEEQPKPVVVVKGTDKKIATFDSIDQKGITRVHEPGNDRAGVPRGVGAPKPPRK